MYATEWNADGRIVESKSCAAPSQWRCFFLAPSPGGPGKHKRTVRSRKSYQARRRRVPDYGRPGQPAGSSRLRRSASSCSRFVTRYHLFSDRHGTLRSTRSSSPQPECLREPGEPNPERTVSAEAGEDQTYLLVRGAGDDSRLTAERRG